MNEIMKDNGTTRESVKESWMEIWGPRIKKQALLEKSTNTKLNSVMNSFSASGKCIYYQIEVTITMYRNHCNFIDVFTIHVKRSQK